jgi:hypothetical protein
MKLWQKVLGITLCTLLVGGIYLYIIFSRRQNPGVIGKADPSQALSQDDLAVVRTFSQQHFEDVLSLAKTSVWMKNGNTIAYFPTVQARIDFAHPVGLIPPAQRMDIRKIVKSAVPPTVDDGIGHGRQQVFAVFTLPGSGTQQYATPLGVIDGPTEAYYCDILYYYDDPHSIYDHWPKDVWTAIDAHQVKPGMSELQTRMAIGQKIHFTGNQEGDRTVTYTALGKTWTITYEKNHATIINAQ